MKKKKGRPMKKVGFRASVFLGRGLDPIEVRFELDAQGDEMSFAWDDVYFGAFDASRERYPEKDFPNMDVKSIEIETDEGLFPVVSEDMDKDQIASIARSRGRVLQLPLARYSITPEFALFNKLVASGLVPRGAEFKFDDMHRMIEDVKQA